MPDKSNSDTSKMAATAPPRVADMAPLVAAVRRFLAQRESAVKVSQALSKEELESRFNLAARKKGRPEVILSEDVFVELGHPQTASRSAVLVTYEKNLVQDGRISLVGPDLPQMAQGEKHPLAQFVLLYAEPDMAADPFDLDNAQYLMHRLPGYMVRSVPGRLWARISRQGKAKGLSLSVLGGALVAAYKDDFPGVLGAEIVFVTSSQEAVKELEPVAVEASIFSGQHKKLVLGIDGSVECTELNCETCDEKPVCDTLRDVVVERKKSARKAR
jgi:CO dehydrogenase/acetyl-CoA synthase beta subunit